MNKKAIFIFTVCGLIAMLAFSSFILIVDAAAI
jgi:hypothetical protein